MVKRRYQKYLRRMKMRRGNICKFRDIISKTSSEKGFYFCAKKIMNIHYSDCRKCKSYKPYKFCEKP